MFAAASSMAGKCLSCINTEIFICTKKGNECHPLRSSFNSLYWEPWETIFVHNGCIKDTWGFCTQMQKPFCNFYYLTAHVVLFLKRYTGHIILLLTPWGLSFGLVGWSEWVPNIFYRLSKTWGRRWWVKRVSQPRFIQEWCGIPILLHPLHSQTHHRHTCS